MKHFEEITNEELKEFFLTDLNTLNDITVFEYPNSLFDEYSPIDEHIIRCQRILQSYLVSELSNFDEELTGQEIDSLASEKAKEIFKLCDPEIQALFETANLKTIKLGRDL